LTLVKSELELNSLKSPCDELTAIIFHLAYSSCLALLVTRLCTYLFLTALI